VEPVRHRRDIQGLRAVAVLAVVTHHLVAWPAGGFVGVDIFFVISGFLITGILLRDYEDTGRISLTGFYSRRIKRILPAAIAAVVATIAASYFLFNGARWWETVWDGIFAALFVANWRFASVGTDYFHTGDIDSPVQHYWSLAVEEQFYLFWPILVIVVLAAAARLSRGRVSRPTLAVMTGIIIAGSFVYAMGQTSETPAVAYFSTLSRAWELGVGALLAVCAPLFARLPKLLRGILGWIGLAGIVASFAVVTSSVAFPAPWAALPVLSAALVLISGSGSTDSALFPLTNPVSVYIGNLSYSLYLWHFPVIIFMRMLLPQGSLTSTLLTLGLITVMSMVSFYLIEQPFHRSPWMMRFDRTTDARATAWRLWREKFGTQFLLSGLALFIVVASIAISTQMTVRGGAPAAAPVAAEETTVNPEAQIQGDLAAALTASAWPDNLSPSLDEVIATTSNRNPARDCFAPGPTPNFDRCTFGDRNAPNHMYLVGDSTALSYAPAFKEIAESSQGQWQVTTVGLYGCRFTEVLVQNDGAGVMDSCEQRKNDVAQTIAAANPQLVVVSNAFALGKSATGAPLSVAQLVASTVAETATYNVPGRVVYLAPPPLGADLGQCYSQVSAPQDCVVQVGSAWQEFAASTQSAATASGGYFVSSLPFSCYNGLCPAFAGTVPTRYDTVHMTVDYSITVAPSIRWAFAALGVM
jgi:peptidoglycan/LPS O-acetylase OafA/YrhL